MTWRGPFRKRVSSEEIGHFKYNHHFVSPTGARFHPNHIDLRIWMVHATAGQSSQILCRWLCKHGGATSRWSRKGSLSRAWHDALRSITDTVISLVLLGNGQVRDIFRKGKSVHTWKMTSSRSGTPWPSPTSEYVYGTVRYWCRRRSVSTMKMIAHVCIPRSRRMALGNLLSHNWSR